MIFRWLLSFFSVITNKQTSRLFKPFKNKKEKQPIVQTSFTNCLSADRYYRRLWIESRYTITRYRSRRTAKHFSEIFSDYKVTYQLLLLTRLAGPSSEISRACADKPVHQTLTGCSVVTWTAKAVVHHYRDKPTKNKIQTLIKLITFFVLWRPGAVWFYFD